MFGPTDQVTWRVWCEHLPLGELQGPRVLELLGSHAMSPVLAVRPDTDFGELVGALRAVREAGLATGVWPLMGLDEGYWPSERNVEAWFARTFEILDELERFGVVPDWIAVDLEPPYGQASRLLRRTLAVPFAAAELAAENMDLARFFASRQVFVEGVTALQRRGLRVLGVTAALAAHDLRDDIPLWQDMFETPWSGVPWDAAGIMAYGSIVAGASRGVFSHADARALHQPLLDHLARRFERRAHVSLGVTGVGVFGDEPSYTEPTELNRDVAAALQSGITDIAVFCLEGILARPDPETWLHAITSARASPPPRTWKSVVARRSGAVIRTAARAFFGR